MEEAKERINCINMAAHGKTGLPSPIAREFCYLQIRFLCELVSIACLVAHGDIAGLQSHKVGKTYSADEILRKMSNLRPHFYPFAIRHQVLPPPIPGQTREHKIELVSPSPLDRDKLLALYADAHKYVHRGSLKRLLSTKEPLDPFFDISDVISKVQPRHDAIHSHTMIVTHSPPAHCSAAQRPPSPSDFRTLDTSTSFRAVRAEVRICNEFDLDMSAIALDKVCQFQPGICLSGRARRPLAAWHSGAS